MKLKGPNLIIVNVIATYVRMFVVMGLMLFSERWVLNALGEVDFGLYSLTGTLIIFILFIGNVMAASMQRFYAYAIGQEDAAEIQKWFNCAFVIHFVFALFLIIGGVPLGMYLLDHVLDIPAGRLNACYWVYYLSIAGAAWTMISVPYIGMFHARQRIFELSFWNSVQAVFIFGLAWSLFSLSGDRLKFYAAGMVGIKMVMDGIQLLRAYYLFKECRLNSRYWFNWTFYRTVLSYAGWQLWSGLGSILSNQGLAVLINKFCGVRANAAYGIAGRVNNVVANVGTAIYQASVAEIFRLEGAGRRDDMITLALRTSKFIMLLAFLWMLPLYIELDYILTLWLKVVPEHVVGFCRVILVTYAVSTLIMGYSGAVGAYGKVGSYQSVQGTLLVLTFPLTWLAFKLGASPEHALLSLVAMAVCGDLYCVFWVKKKMNVPVSRWVKDVLLKCLIVVIPSTLVGSVVYSCLESSFWRTLLVFCLTGASTLSVAWYLALDHEERRFCLDKVHGIWKRLSGSKNEES
jgi:O-antigen/teichoic acid export membrane protein